MGESLSAEATTLVAPLFGYQSPRPPSGVAAVWSTRHERGIVTAALWVGMRTHWAYLVGVISRPMFRLIGAPN